jgi:hypothetical protein
MASGGADKVTIAVARTLPVPARHHHSEGKRSQQDAELQY